MHDYNFLDILEFICIIIDEYTIQNVTLEQCGHNESISIVNLKYICFKVYYINIDLNIDIYLYIIQRHKYKLKVHYINIVYLKFKYKLNLYRMIQCHFKK